jgi:methylated-DNA-[protein]-cysteine S-methyltransferase
MSSLPEPLYLDQLPTPIGVMCVIVDGEGALRALDWDDHEPRMQRLLRLHHGAGFALSARPLPDAVRRPLEAYFSGDLGAIEGLRVHTGGTPFQREVWAALRTIRHGTTLSYGALAQLIGRPSSVRAVGLANGANPVGIVVPCHRVIGATGSLTGYGGGLPRKKWLLEHEGVGLAQLSLLSP